jgi:hypothetical protein
MKFITVRDIRTSPARIWKELPEETLGSIRRGRAMTALRKMRQHAEARGPAALSEKEIQTEIDAVRLEREE